MDKLQDEIYISVEKYCKMKNIGRGTFYRRKKKNQISFEITKLKGYGKKHFLIVKNEDIMSIDKDNKIIM